MSARTAKPTRAAPPPGTGRLPPWASGAADRFNRIASSKVARTVVTIGILAIAAVLIRGELKSANLADVGHAIASTPLWAIGACATCTVATYLCEAAVPLARPNPMAMERALEAEAAKTVRRNGSGLPM